MSHQPSRPPLRQTDRSPIQPRPSGWRAQIRGFFRYLDRLSRGQLLLGTIGLLVVCSMIGGTVFTILVDATRPDGGNDNELDFASQQSQLIEEQRQYVEDHPSDASAMALLAQLLALDGQLTEAISWYEQALAINPNDVSIRLNFADTLTQAGRYSDAELQYRRALEIEPNNIQAAFYLGDLYQTWQPAPRYAEAAALYEQVLAMAPDSVLAQRAAEQLVAMGLRNATTGDASHIGYSRGDR